MQVGMLIGALCMSSVYIAGQEEHPRLDYPYYLDYFTQPWKDAEQAPDNIEFAFEDAQLINIIRYVEKQLNLTFILDDALDPLPDGGQSALGTKVSFKTHEPLSREDAWNVFLTFLDMAGLAPHPGPYERSYRITAINPDPKAKTSVYKEPLPTYLGVHPEQLPDSDMRVRYVYFVRNADMNVIKNIMDSMKGSQSPQLVPFPEMRGIMITDKAFNIQAIMRIVRELDTATQPETMSIIKLQKTDATRVADLYKELVKEDDKQQNLSSRLLGSKREETVRYFPTGTRVIPEPRTNTLIILGTQSAIEKIESFIKNEVDREVNVPFKPVHVYPLNHIQAESAKKILDETLKFQKGSEAAQSGGVRGGDQYMKPVSVVAEPRGNRLIITADYAEYYKIDELLQQIDVEQPQVALKVMLVNIDLNDQREAGTQLRNKVPGTEGILSDEVNFQTTGLNGRGLVTNQDTTAPGAQRLLGNLIRLATGETSTGATFITLGSDQFGVWGMFRLLQTYAQSNIISNPFLVATNNTTAELQVGETRNVQNATAVAAAGTTVDSFTEIEANLSVTVTPRISYEGYVTLDVKVTDEQFTQPASVNDVTAGNRNERTVETSVILENNEVLALGGLIRTRFQETETGVPLLKNIPGFGYLFKNKSKQKERNSLLVLITPEIIPIESNHVAQRYTDEKVETARDTLEREDYKYIAQDPFHRWFFNDLSDAQEEHFDAYIERAGRYQTFQDTEEQHDQEVHGASEQRRPYKPRNTSQRRGKQKLSQLLSDKDAS